MTLESQTRRSGEATGFQHSVTTTDDHPVTPRVCIFCKLRPADWVSPTGHPACTDCRISEKLTALWRREARERSVRRQRTDAAAAVARTPQRPIDDGETRRLYEAMTGLEDAGLVQWNARTADWEKVGTSAKVWSNDTNPYSDLELLGHFDRNRLQSHGKSRWSVRCPAHEDRSPSLSITRTGTRWLLHCFAGCTFNEVCDAAHLDAGRLFS